MNEFKKFPFSEARDVLYQLDLMLFYHDEWFSNFTRGIICDQPLGDEYIAEDAYQACRFGQWLYGNIDAKVKQTLIVQDIELIHKNMHLKFRDCYLKWMTHKTDIKKEYDEALIKRTAFKLTVNTLQFMIYDYLLQTDPLTKTFNRTKLLSTLERERNRIEETGENCAVVMADIDHFKHVNDQYGHAVGDMVLVQTSVLLRNILRPMDLVFRYGGEEFLLYLPGVDKKAALIILDRLRARIAENSIMISEDKTINITISFGGSRLDPGAEIAESVRKADEALYLAKTGGRNRVEWVE
ncbi:MAG: diguanylate cyclase [Magnetococcus sp. YQC-5]